MKGDYSLYKTRSYVNAWLDYNNLNHKNKIGYWQFRKVLSTLTDEIMTEVINCPLGIELPEQLGSLVMIGFKVDKLPKMNKVKFKMATTDGYVYRLRWTEGVGTRKWKLYFHFDVGKAIQKRIYEAIKDNKFFNWIRVPSYMEYIKYREK